MACLLAIIVALGRLSADSELVVLRSVGLSLKKILIPVGIFGVLITLSALFISLVVRPWANYNLGLGLFRLATAQVSTGLVAGTFNKIGPLTIYAREIQDNGGLLKDVLISDQRDAENPKLFFAQNAKLRSFEESRQVKFELFEGSMHEGSGGNLSETTYSRNAITISESELEDSNEALARKKTVEMSTNELVSEIAIVKEKISRNDPEVKQLHYSRLRVELQRRIVLPACCISVAILALALGIQPSRGNSKWGPTLSFVTGIIIILSYYILFAVVTAISEESGKLIELYMWLPNLVFFILGIFLFRQISSEKYSSALEMFNNTKSLKKIYVFFNKITSFISDKLILKRK